MDISLKRLASTFLALAFTTQTTFAYDKDNRLVDYYDHIKVVSSKDPDTTVYKTDLYSFPYMKKVTNNQNHPSISQNAKLLQPDLF